MVTISAVAVDRVTVNTAFAAPVFPSTMVTSPMLRLGGGGGGGGQSPSLSSTDTVFDSPFAATTSGRPSPLKSPTATAEGHEPTVYAAAYVRVTFPLPNNSLTVSVPASEVTASSLPSPLKSATATPVWKSPLA